MKDWRAAGTKPSQTVIIEVEIVTTGKKAWFCRDAKGYVWLPKSHCSLVKGRPKSDGTRKMRVPTWMAEEKGMI